MFSWSCFNWFWIMDLWVHRIFPAISELRVNVTRKKFDVKLISWRKLKQQCMKLNYFCKIYDWRKLENVLQDSVPFVPLKSIKFPCSCQTYRDLKFSLCFMTSPMCIYESLITTKRVWQAQNLFKLYLKDFCRAYLLNLFSNHKSRKP